MGDGMDDDAALGVRTDLPFEAAIMRTRLRLRSNGFSIISEMPAPAVVGEGRRHLFMSIWERLISTGNLGGLGLDVGDHLACNVVVFEEGVSTVVAALDPLKGLEGWTGAGAETAEAASRALRKAIIEVPEDPNAA
jgi:hypothetical protein